ncbi:hypothetical protein MARA_18460 [Mycolicibacterium arabiense]|uniref:Uncharacterized protein n=1 Tax=Mycolicibacterium arabiense TaxID=1286181 RepID=A0A7I7RUW8_9MYCO|nr:MULTISPECIES: hypothetical protein [Mycobacteriaceae]MCV7375233.1 hypothetical protein [Mycolicibacterium arabiense]BBY48378.1 hypothetical protein MARA_18460 [Mycolicibacterium arabiense]
MANDDAGKKFAKRLFSDPEDTDADADARNEPDTDPEFTDAERAWARELFADNGADAVLAGLKAGRTIGRTTPPTN